ncbi:MAG: adenylate kinase [bacterium]
MILIFLGPPGSGKGTQAKMLAEKNKIPHISLGDILREEVRQGTPIGKKAKEAMNAGKLVPDELTIELTEKRIGQPDCKNGFIIDGFPRSFAQAEALDKMFVKNKLEIDKVIYFGISKEDVVKRLSGRRSCGACGAVYHIESKRPKMEGKCDICGGELAIRPDDKAEVIATRFEVYEKQTRPLIEFYQAKGKLLEIDAALPIEQVSKALA